MVRILKTGLFLALPLLTLVSEICTGNIDICYKSCKTCSGLGNEEKNLCESCDEEEEYYWKENKISTNCILKNTETYYLDETNENEKVLRKCYESCKKCEPEGNYNNHKCKECINDYYKLLIDPTNLETFNCYHKDNLIDYYYANEETEEFEECELHGCKTCSKNSDDDSFYRCLSCDIDYGYYPIYREELLNEEKVCNCITLDMLKNDDDYKSYYFDINNREIKKCYKTCESCLTEGNEQINNCKTCKNGLILSNDGLDNCICSNQKYYYRKPQNSSTQK